MKHLCWFLLLLSNFLLAQNQDRNLDHLRNFYVCANLGLINYNYGEEILPENTYVESITAKNTFGGRFAFGFRLGENYRAQFSVMRPAAWTSYNNVDHTEWNKTVWTNIWAISALRDFRISDKWDLFFEAGISNVTRVGFSIDDREYVESLHYIYPIGGAGVAYHLSDKFDLTLNATYSPPKSSDNQPSTYLIAAGMNFYVPTLSEEKKQAVLESPYYFPKNQLLFGYSSDFMGFNINRQFSSGLQTSIPMFWLGDVYAENGFWLSYQRTVFQTKKTFSLELGTSFSYYNTRGGDDFWALSVYPNVKWWFLRTQPVDFYFNYSLIGPTYLSDATLDGIDTGEKATFQDFMGLGMIFGDERAYQLDFKIAHYSNGNIFTENPGVAIPLTIGFGYSFP
ncbi:acyloxyacyl hydrolase [Mesonia sp. K7]|uniref:acyloxyacyl hydrolase n=1 Tax=Mesonia sp. K7 TaxID=2218606 RepID=UPI000DA94F30|nr:acyloxyacyl hydrolase [Mesonia sp. K7]PZD79207.1 hypothetical protein DNG35_01585 [Mesonia sp. K7]